MSNPPSWIERQWRDIRGNVKWDVIKWASWGLLTMIAPSCYVLFQKLRQLSLDLYVFGGLFFVSLLVTLFSAPLRKREIALEVERYLGKTPGRRRWDAVADFSIVSNPAGAWSYGWSKNGLGNGFVPHTRNLLDAQPGVDRWDSPEIQQDIDAMHNKTGNDIRPTGYVYTIPKDMLHMHPGEGGIYDIVRWTCPQRGRYAIVGEFRGLDDNKNVADSDVNVVLNSSKSLFRSRIPVLHGTGTYEPFSFRDISLSAGDTIDFVVGVGPSSSHGSDSTGLKATIILQ